MKLKNLLITTIIIISTGQVYCQEFEYYPNNQRARFQGVSGDAAVEMSIGVYNGQTEHGRLSINDNESYPFVDLTYSDGGKIILSKFEGKQMSEFGKDGLSLIDQSVTRYKLELATGLQTFDQNGMLQYVMSETGGFQGVDNRGHISTQLSNEELIVFREDKEPKVKISNALGLEVFNNNNGNLMYRMNGQILSGFKNDGTETIRINTNLGGDGRISTDELEIMGGSDFSENFDIEEHASSSIEPGMLVSITGEEGKLALSSSKRDKKVVGIISGANGIETGMIMGQKGSIADGDYPIALSGRTYVYANTENGPIVPGDFITTSSTPGYGMKVKKHKKAQGAIVGKAMTSLDGSSGYVLVLVNLQ